MKGIYKDFGKYIQIGDLQFPKPKSQQELEKLLEDYPIG